MAEVLIITNLAATFTLAGCNSPAKSVVNETLSYDDQMEQAQSSPYGAYPDEITYTLGKLTGANNSNMPEGDTYENNAYTRYIKSTINVQNKDMIEAMDTDYDTSVSMAIATGNLPDIMVVSSYEDLSTLIQYDMIEDLTDSYDKCTTQKIKDMYASYGESLIDAVTYDGKLMALPETNITDGPNLVWLRKDWMDKLGLTAPKTMQDVEEIVLQFMQNDPGNNGAGNTVGLVCDTSLAGECGYSSEYLLDLIFASFGAYPKQWIRDESGNVVYGSVTDQAKQALGHISSLYEQGIIDHDFLLRTAANIREVIQNGQCGSFFGPWWAPNNPLQSAISNNKEADWEPFLIATDQEGNTTYHSQNPVYKYIVVRKGYEHPEIAAKIISIMFDKIRFECDNSEEFANYYQLNVDPTARPLAINVDYKDALKMCYHNIDTALTEGDVNLQLLERSYYDACKGYLADPQNATPDLWAAYTSRIRACAVMNSGKVKEVPSLFFGSTPTMRSDFWKLKEQENEAYLKIICKEEELSYFDTFVKNWYENGGDKITEEVSQICNK